jgi:hypothetical protein
VKVRQSTRFAIFSADVTADEMTERVGLEPDEVLVQGRRRSGPPPVPRSHAWKLVDRGPGRIDDQAERLIARLRPHRDRLVALCREPGFSVGLLIGRHFPDEDGVPDGFGWHLDAQLVEFLAAVGASIDVDEYDYSDEAGDAEADD